MSLALFSPQLGMETFNLEPYAARLQARLAAWEVARVGRRIWQKDPTVWVPDPEQAAQTRELSDRLGWLTSPEEMAAQVPALAEFAGQVVAAGCRDVVLLGMGGSSLAPELYSATFGAAPGHPRLTVLDSTDPAAVAAIAAAIDPARTLFVVSSKSGGTLETLSFYEFFWNLGNAGGNFVAITDPGTSLESLAARQGFRRVFPGPPEVGGRYSALTYFGLVAAALLGVPLEDLLARAQQMAQACGPQAAAADNPGLALGAILGELARAGRDKVTFFLSPGLRAYGLWVEQLIAESTGKQDTGLVPVPEDDPGPPDSYGSDRLLVYLRLQGDDNAALDAAWEALIHADQPGVRVSLPDPLDLGAEFFRWEMATAAASAVLGVNPFDQPNVAAAKRKAAELVQQYEATGSLPAPEPLLTESDLQLFGGPDSLADTILDQLRDFLAPARPGDYVALQAYLPPTAASEDQLRVMQQVLRDNLRLAVTRGWGPRFLHSTGQLHKGDAGNGLFLQITHDPAPDLPVPGHPYSFGVIIAAQAQGDFQALQERGRRVLRLHLTGPVEAGLEKIAHLLEQAAGH